MLVSCGAIKPVHYEDRFTLLAEAAPVQGQRIVDVQGQSHAGPIAEKRRRNRLCTHTLSNICKARIHLMGPTYNNNIGATWLGGDTLE